WTSSAGLTRGRIDMTQVRSVPVPLEDGRHETYLKSRSTARGRARAHPPGRSRQIPASFQGKAAPLADTRCSEMGIRHGKPCAHIPPPRLEPAAQLLGLVGARTGQVAGFTRIVGELIELDVLVLEVFEQFPVARAYRTDRRSGRIVVRVVEV